MSAGGIMTDHAANGGAIRGRSIRPELQPHTANVSVQLILHQSRLHSTPQLFAIHFEHVAHVLGKVEDDGMADGLSGQRGAAPSRQNRDAELVGNLDYRLDIPSVARHDYTDGPDLLNRRVGGIKQAGVTIEANVAFDSLL